MLAKNTTTGVYHHLLNSYFAGSYLVGSNYVSSNIGPKLRGIFSKSLSSLATSSLTKPTTSKDGGLVAHLTCYGMIPHNRIGNLMFQYAALVGICARKGFSVDDCGVYFNQKAPANQNNNLLPIKEFQQEFSLTSARECPFQGAHIVEKVSGSNMFDASLFNATAGSVFNGFWQSWKYFHPHASEIVKERFRFQPHHNQGASTFIDDIQKKIQQQGFASDYHLVGMHIRRGDKVGNAFYNQWAISASFYMQAVEAMRRRVGDKLAILVMTGGAPDAKGNAEDVAWVQKNIVAPLSSSGNTLVFTPPPDMHHLTAMRVLSLCPNMILGASSFSWWAAYLAPNATTIIAPNKQTSDEKLFIVEDYYLPEWILIEEDAPKAASKQQEQHLSMHLTTAFIDINRSHWEGGQKMYVRDNDKYFTFFSHLAKVSLPLVCYTSKNLQSSIRNLTGFGNFEPYEPETTFLNLINTEKRIMSLESYQQLVQFKNNPEHTIPLYNIVNWNKAIFLQRSFERYPNYTHYAWVDFGYSRTPQSVPSFVSLAALADGKIHYSAFTDIVAGHVDEAHMREFVSKGNVLCPGSFFVVPARLVPWFVIKWTATIKTMHSYNITDDDQTVAYFLIRQHRDAFTLHRTSAFFQDFKEYLSTRGN